MPGIIRTKVINTALRLIGASQTNMQASGSSPISTMAASVFTDVLRTVLASHPWSFAMRYAELAKLSTTPLFGYAYAYQIPTDCVRFSDARTTPFSGSTEAPPRFDAPAIDYERVGSAIYTDATPCYARYASADCEPLAHEPFIEALAARLAIEIAPSVSSGGVSPEKLEQRYIYALELAKCFDGDTQHPPRTSPATGSNFVRRRFAGEYPPEMR